MALFDVVLVHGSNANRSPQRRAALVLRIMPTTSHFDRALGIEIGKTVRPPDMGTRPLFLLRGIDHCGLNDLSVGTRSPTDLWRDLVDASSGRDPAQTVPVPHSSHQCRPTAHRKPRGWFREAHSTRL